ncbi:unnamed protein product, partial [Meganyctiphanes norvegica]
MSTIGICGYKRPRLVERKCPKRIHCPAGFVDLDERCYLFSEQLGESPRSQLQAKMFCQVIGGDLANIGHHHSSQSDPVLKYLFDNGMAQTEVWLGAERTGSTFTWTDGRDLSEDSPLWWYNQPNGDACVHTIASTDSKRVYLLDNFCTKERAFVCEKM